MLDRTSDQIQARDRFHSFTAVSHRTRRWAVVGLAVIAGVALNLTLAASAGAAGPNGSPQSVDAREVAAAVRVATPAAASMADPSVRAGGGSTYQPDDEPSCTFNGATDIVPNVTPGSSLSIACTGWEADDQITAAEISPMFLVSGSTDDLDANFQTFTSDGSGNLNATFVVPNPFTAADPAAVCPPTATQVAQGYLRCGVALADGDENVALVALDYSSAPPPPPPSSTAVGMAATPDGGGYWVAWSNGNVTVHGDAQSYGNASQLNLNQPITHIVSSPAGNGYWLVAADGGTFAFGDAGFYGSMGGQHLNKPVVDMAPTNDGRGYWLVASDGGIFAFGDAAFDGSMGGQPLNKPVVGISQDPVTGGYWLVASDGGIFAFGAPFFGSTGALHLNQPVNGMSATTDGQGYWFVASDGGIFAFGDAGFHGSMGGSPLAAPIVGMATDNATGGYWLVGSDGGIFSFDAPFYGSA